jgi:DNA-binding transcriptional LysR family regulator
VVLDVSFIDHPVDMVDEGYDLALRLISDERLPAGVVARRVRAVPFRLAASRAYLERQGVPKVPEVTEFPPPVSNLYLIYPDRKHVPFKARAFIDLVLGSEAGRQYSSQSDRHPSTPMTWRQGTDGRWPRDAKSTGTTYSTLPRKALLKTWPDPYPATTAS